MRGKLIGSFGLNHYGTSYATGKRASQAEAEPFRIGFGSYETVYEKDGKVIGLKGHNGHPYTGAQILAEARTAVSVVADRSVPWGFRKLLNYIHTRYLVDTDLAIYVTENGFPVENEGDLTLEQALDDPARQAYFAAYIKEMALAHKEDGVRMGGYMAWSLLE